MFCLSPSLLSWEGSWGATKRLEMCQQSFQLGLGAQGKAGRRWGFTAEPEESSHQQQTCSGSKGWGEGEFLLSHVQILHLSLVWVQKGETEAGKATR